MNSPRSVDLVTHPLSGHSLIEASAGTGKTYTISHLYVRYILECKLDVQQLLVVTFTNAATQELKGRIHLRIHEVLNFLTQGDAEDPSLEELFGHYRGDVQALLRLQKALVNFDQAAVYSIHGFCQRLLNSFPLEMQTLLQLKINTDQRSMQLLAVQDVWRTQFTQAAPERCRWLRSLWNNPDALLQAILPLLGYHSDGYELLQGETTKQSSDDITQLWQLLKEVWLQSQDDVRGFLVDSGALNRNRVRVTTVSKLLVELQGLFCSDLPYSLPEKWPLLGYKKLSQSLKKNEQDDRIHEIFFQLTDDFSDRHQQWLEQQKRQMLVDAASAVIQTLHKNKLINQMITFDDLVSRVNVALASASPPLLDRITTLFPVAMVDEFQDTDNQQYRIFTALYGKHEGLVMIGDPKQAIYSFRGADVFTYQQARRNVELQFTLDTNYRSTAEYVTMVNRLFSENPNTFIFKDFIRYSPSRSAIKKELTLNGIRAEPLVAWIYPFSPQAVAKAQAEQYFARLCATEIRTLLKQKQLLLDGSRVTASDLAILVRTGRQASLMKQQLAELGISSALTSRDSVFSSHQAWEICQLLDVLIEPSNTAKLFGLLSTDLFAYTASDIYQVQQDNQHLVRLIRQIQQYQKHWRDQGILSMFFRLMQDQKTLFNNIQHLDGERKVTNWLHIMEILQQQSGIHASHQQALQWLVKQREKLAQSSEVDEHQLRLESDSQLVRIVTIHKSKGLQYPIVFLPFAWHTNTTSARSDCYSYHDEEGNKRMKVFDESERPQWVREQLAEDVRLFYVAMTRAQYRCYLGWGHINDVANSALAHCLYERHIDKHKYPYSINLENQKALRQPFERLNLQQPLVEIIEGGLPAADSEFVDKKLKSKTPAREFKRQIQQQWRISSYSHIVSHESAEQMFRPDHDDQVRDTESPMDEVPVKLDRFHFQKGASAGNFLHEILEHQPFDQPVDEALIQLKCKTYAIDDQWLSCLSEWISDVLHCPLQGHRLSDIGASQRLSEMEFYMSSQNLRADTLNELLLANGYCQPEQMYSFTTINGFMKGFIDLVFEYQGKYFIADYKSNYLGPTHAFYSPEHCKQAMFSHHYHLQLLVYTVALHRHLGKQLPGYDYDRHVGGVYYLFLRGMSVNSEKGNGIFYHRPQQEMIEKLDKSFRS